METRWQPIQDKLCESKIIKKQMAPTGKEKKMDHKGRERKIKIGNYKDI